MNCEKFSHIIDDYISGSLSSERRGECEGHIASCEACARQVALVRSVCESLHDAPQVKAPAGLAERILAAVEAEEATAEVIKFPGTIYAGSGIDCVGFDENAAAYVDGLLDSGFAAALDDHRASCPSCERLAEAHRAVASAFRDVEPVKAPSDMSARILAAAREAEPVEVPQFIPLYRRFGAYVAAASGFGAVAAAIMIVIGAVRIVSAQSGIMALFESFMTDMTTVPLLAKAWLAAQITPDQWVLIEQLAKPVNIPYVPVELPPYMLGALIVFSAGMAFSYRLVQCRYPSYGEICF